MGNEQERRTANLAVRLGTGILLHPIEYAKVLIQLGYEPISPYPTKTLLGKPALGLPNVFTYVSYIKKVDGVSGCFRGVSPKICASLVYAAVYTKTSSYLNSGRVSDEEQEGMTEEDRCWNFLRKMYLEVSARTTAVIVSQPLSVVALRMMAQFVGGETRYNGLFSSLAEIYHVNGITGFFSGLAPRWIGDITSVLLASTLTFIANNYFVEDKDLHYIVAAMMTFLASSVTYPLQLVSTCMAVVGSGLTAGSPPMMPLYTSWIDCWSHLSEMNQMKRGSSLVWRTYSGPSVPNVNMFHHKTG